MKITDKLSKVNFDTLKFFDMIDPKGKNIMELDTMLTELAGTFKLFFSVQEQLAIRNELFPSFRDEDVILSKKRKLTLRSANNGFSSSCFEDTLFYDSIDFMTLLPNFAINKTTFVEMTIQQFDIYK